jgi:peroxiredoxin
MNSTNPTEQPSWITPILRAAAVYNLVWGVVAILSPDLIFKISGMESPVPPAVFQMLGLLIASYGIGYWLVSKNPFRHWPIVFVGLVGKILSVLGFLVFFAMGRIPLAFGFNILINDLIWIVPFASILYHAFSWNSNPAVNSKCPTYDEAIRLTRSQRGETLEKLSYRNLTMVIFLRHAGCTFCRETLGDLRDLRERISEKGISVAIVHMGNPLEGTRMLGKYDLDHMHHFSDPQCRLYRAFGLERGRWSQLFSWKVLRRGWQAGVKEGHGMGKLAGDSFQLPGVYFLCDGRVVFGYPTQHAAERIDYLGLIDKAIARLDSPVKGEIAVAN